MEMRKRIVEQLEKEKLLEILLEKIYFKNTVVNKIETGRSGFNPSFKKIDLVYRTTFYFESSELFSEIQNRQYDEWDFVTLSDQSPVLIDKIIKPTEYQMKQLLLKLPEDQLVNIILKAKSIQDYRKYQLSERIIAYLEHYNLTRLLQNHIRYINTYERKRIIEKSQKTEDWWQLNIVELTYITKYFFENYGQSEHSMFYTEESNITYDEGDYILKEENSPLNEQVSALTKKELFSLIKRLPYDELNTMIKQIEQIVDSLNEGKKYCRSLKEIPKLRLK